LRGISRAAVTLAVRPGGALHAAYLPDVRMVDVAHPAAQAYLASRRSPSARSEAAAVADAAAIELGIAPVDVHVAPGELERVRDEAISRFGSLAQFVAVAQAARISADARLAQRKDAALAGRLISREHVRAYVFAPIDACFRQLLTDAARTIGLQVPALVRSGRPLEDVIALIQDIQSRALSGMRERMLRGLRSAPASDSPPAVGESTRSHGTAPMIDRRLREQLEQQLRARAGDLVDVIGRELARAAAGKPFDAALFDQARELVAPVREEAARNIGVRMVALLDRVVRDHERERREETLNVSTDAA
jgi:hypothetical protein